MNGDSHHDTGFDRALVEGLAAAAAERSSVCPAAELYLLAAQGELEAAEAERLALHAEACPFCAAERDLASAWVSSEAGVDAADLAAVVARLAPAAGGKVVSFPARPGTPKPMARPASWRRWAGIAALAAAAGLATVAVRTGMGPGAPGKLPAPPATDVVRSGAVDGLTPAGEQPGAPARLSWEPVDQAARYAVELLAVDDEPLWKVEVTVPAADLPAELRGKLLPGVVYRWRVDALAADGRVVAVSEAASFRLTPPSESADGSFTPLSSSP